VTLGSARISNSNRRFIPETWAQLDGTGMADETIGRPYPRPPRDAREFFHFWMTDVDSKMPMMSDDFFALEQSYQRERGRSNLLLVHYNDLKADLSGEMKRIADFLNITVPDELRPQLVEAASFEAMKRDGAKLLAGMELAFQNGHGTFRHSGTNNRWRGVLNEADLDSSKRKSTPNFHRGWFAG
jgi:aryl sulfotransferase